MSSQDQTPANTGTTIDARIATKTVFDTLAADGRFGAFVDALRQGGFEGLLRGPGNFTVLATSDLKGDVARHIIRGKNLTADLRTAGGALKPLAGEPIRIVFDKGVPRLGGASLDHTDIACSNGVVHELADPLG